MLRLIGLLALATGTAGAAKGMSLGPMRQLRETTTEEQFFCLCVCNGDEHSAGIWISQAHPDYNSEAEQGEDADGVSYSYACAKDDDIFEYLYTEEALGGAEEVYCDDSCNADKDEGEDN